MMRRIREGGGEGGKEKGRRRRVVRRKVWNVYMNFSFMTRLRLLLSSLLSYNSFTPNA
jgi:hypothetical protein